MEMHTLARRSVVLTLAVLIEVAAAHCAAPAQAQSCVGDCDGGGTVTINEIIVLVNMALGNITDLTRCPNGIPSDITDPSQVNIGTIIKAVNNALAGACP